MQSDQGEQSGGEQSGGEDEDDLQDLADNFKGKLRQLSGSLQHVTSKCSSLNNELGIADNSSAEFAARCVCVCLHVYVCVPVYVCVLKTCVPACVRACVHVCACDSTLNPICTHHMLSMHSSFFARFQM